MLKGILWMLMGQVCPGGAECVPIHPPCELGTTLQTFTIATTPTDLTRVKLGVGEQTSLSMIPAPPCEVTWTVSGGGTLSASTGSSVVFTAHYRASVSTVTAWVNEVSFSVVYTVVEPSSVTGVKLQEISYPAGTYGSGMSLRIIVNPIDVSFRNVEMRELPGPATNVFGYFTQFTAASLAHEPEPLWTPLGSDNGLTDNVETRNRLPPYSPGGFEWQIPTRWRVVNIGSSEANVPPAVLQQFRITDSSGTSSVFKAGAFVSRTP
jgi:hypothetical protein